MKLPYGPSLIMFPLALALSLQAMSTAAPAKKPASQATRVKQGRAIYAANECSACHQIGGQGSKSGVRLDNLPATHNRQFILSQLKDPESHVAKNAAAFGGDSSMMPRPQLTTQEAELIADYILSIQQKPAKKSR